jgi:hypothetical protein
MRIFTNFELNSSSMLSKRLVFKLFTLNFPNSDMTQQVFSKMLKKSIYFRRRQSNKRKERKKKNKKKTQKEGKMRVVLNQKNLEVIIPVVKSSI